MLDNFKALAQFDGIILADNQIKTEDKPKFDSILLPFKPE